MNTEQETYLADLRKSAQNLRDAFNGMAEIILSAPEGIDVNDYIAPPDCPYPFEDSFDDLALSTKLWFEQMDKNLSEALHNEPVIKFYLVDPNDPLNDQYRGIEGVLNSCEMTQSQANQRNANNRLHRLDLRWVKSI